MTERRTSPYDAIKVIGSVTVRLGSVQTNQLYLPRGVYEELSEEDLKEMLLNYMIKTGHIEVNYSVDDRHRAGGVL